MKNFTITETSISNDVLKITIGDSLRFKGDILIIDPCYLDGGVLNEQWDDFCEMMFEAHKGRKISNQDISSHGILTVNGVDILYTSTAYGDGVYDVKTNKNTEGKECGVDAGMLCIINVEDLDKVCTKACHDNEFTDLGVIVKDVDCEITMDGEGNVTSSQVDVFTDDSNDEEE